MTEKTWLYLDIDGVLNFPRGSLTVPIVHEEPDSKIVPSVNVDPAIIEALAGASNVSFCSVWRDKTPIFAKSTGLPDWEWLDFEIEWSLRADQFRTQVVASKVGAIVADMSVRGLRRAIFVDDWAHFIPFGILERAERRGLHIITTDGREGIGLERTNDIITALETTK